MKKSPKEIYESLERREILIRGFKKLLDESRLSTIEKHIKMIEFCDIINLAANS